MRIAGTVCILLAAIAATQASTPARRARQARDREALPGLPRHCAVRFAPTGQERLGGDADQDGGLGRQGDRRGASGRSSSTWRGTIRPRSCRPSTSIRRGRLSWRAGSRCGGRRRLRFCATARRMEPSGPWRNCWPFLGSTPPRSRPGGTGSSSSRRGRSAERPVRAQPASLQVSCT